MLSLRTDPPTVTITAPCDRDGCTADATCHGTRTEPGQSTSYEIDCPRCDQTWTIAQQIARRLERLRTAVIERTAA